MRMDKLTIKAQEAIQQAQQLAEQQSEYADRRGASAGGAAGAERGRDRADSAEAGRQCRPAARSRCRRKSPNCPKCPARRKSATSLTPRLRAGHQRGVCRSRAHEGRVRQHGAPAARHRGRHAGAGGAAAQSAGRDAGQSAAGAAGRARQPARHRPEPGREVPGAGKVRARSNGTGAQAETRPGYRARRRDTARGSGAVAPHQEQPGSHRRTGRRQDGHCGRPGAAHRRGRRAGRPERQARRRAGSGRLDRGREVSGRV